jgi:hypothetical protein
MYNFIKYMCECSSYVFNYQQVNRVLLFHLIDQLFLFLSFSSFCRNWCSFICFTWLQIFVDFKKKKKSSRHFMYISKFAYVYAYYLTSHIYMNVFGNLWKIMERILFFSQEKKNAKQSLISIQIIFSLILT